MPIPSTSHQPSTSTSSTPTSSTPSTEQGPTEARVIRNPNPMTDLHCACGSLFDSKDLLKQHEDSVHNQPKNFDCTCCTKVFQSLKALKNHVRKAHFNHHRFSCSECGQGTEALGPMLIHISTHHGGDKNEQCDLCGKMFAIKEQVKRHKEECGKGKVFTCQYCETRFKSEAYLDKHVERHHDFSSAISCTVCRKSFDNKQGYIRHLSKSKCHLTLKQEALDRGESAPGLDEDAGEGEVMD